MAGVNVREQDFIDAANIAVTNLLSRGVDIIVDGGDIAHVPAPKKRAIAALISLINRASVPYYSADGNHTSLKSTSDIHLYDILSTECPNFRGYKIEGLTDVANIGMIPHSYDPEEIKRRIDIVMKWSPTMLVGHFAASDIDFDSSKVPIEFLPTDIPVFLGHYHKHQEGRVNYLGSTSRTAWDQWDFPMGVTIYDTATRGIEYIQHPTRPFVNLLASEEDYLDVLDKENLEDAIVRLTISTSRETYGTLNTREAKRKANASGALQFTYRRAKDPKDEEGFDLETTQDISLEEAWINHIKGKKKVSGVKMKEIQRLGVEALR